MRQYEMFELKFRGTAPAGSQASVNLEAVFAAEEETVRVKGFYAGDGTYIVRFYPKKVGHYTWKVTGAVEAAGEENCDAAVYPGMVKAEDTHFVYENGEPYYPFGTTIYALAHQSRELIEQTFGSLETAPFNKVRHCVFPKHYAYNHNEPDFYPFEKKEDGSWDVHRPCYAYWDHMEGIIHQLGKMGIESDLILFHPYDRWGFSTMSMEDNLVYLDYVLRRLSAIPYIWWSLANEYDVVFARSMEDWYAIEDFVAENDPYHHLLSNHNCMKFYDFSRPNITHCCIQTSAMYMTGHMMERFGKPVVFDECEYEGDIEFNWGNISAFEMVNRFWKAYTSGGFATHGETYYSEDEILWWARGGVLKGESPQRIVFLREIISELPGFLKPWQEPIYEDHENEPPGASVERFMGIKKSLTEEERVNLEWKDGQFGGHIGDDVFLKYLGNQCCSVSAIRLPEDHAYKVEVIDCGK
ncbi:MAG: DUF4038 domain-containing protein [Clostridiales bacterium]|nr:DUF4038 domain-containing protein [Clostridiales bacterium]